jgi:hypothetical protein
MNQIQEVHRKAQQKIYAMLGEYQLDKSILEVRHLEAIDRILDAGSPVVAELLARKAIDKVEATLLAMWATGKVPGKFTPALLEKQAKGAEYWAKVQAEKAESALNPKARERATKYAKKQQERADRLKDEARLLREKKEAVVTAPEVVKPKRMTRLTAKPTRRRKSA